MNTCIDKNQHLKNALDDYTALTSPRYAVLVKGPWGCGKTFQVQKHLGEKMHYLSLYGVGDTKDLHHEVKRAINSKAVEKQEVSSNLSRMEVILALIALLGSLVAYEHNEQAWWHGSVVSLILIIGFIIVRSTWNYLQYSNLSPKHPIVFDDVERSNIPLKDLMGAMNFYVEHKKYHVILIAHEDEINKDEAHPNSESSNYFSLTKEKMIGQTVTVEPDVTAVFDVFLKEIPNEPRSFVETHKDTLLQAFDKVGNKNLRILRHLMLDLARLHKGITPEHETFTEAMRKTIKHFCHFNLDIRCGDNIVKKIQELLNSNHDNQGDTEFEKRSKDRENLESQFKQTHGFKYNLYGTELVRTPALQNALNNGNYDKEAIENAFNADPQFKTLQNSKPWEVANPFSFHRAEESAKALEDLNLIIKDRSEKNLNNIFEIYRVKYTLQLLKVEETSVDDLTTQAKAYLDKMFNDDPHPEKWAYENNSTHSHQWYDSFFSELRRKYAGNSSIELIINYAESKTREVEKRNAPARVLESLKDNNYHEFERYAGLYIDSTSDLPKVDIQEFTQAFVNCESEMQGVVLSVLGRGDDTGRVGHPWKSDVIGELEELAKKLRETGEMTDRYKAARIANLSRLLKPSSPPSSPAPQETDSETTV